MINTGSKKSLSFEALRASLSSRRACVGRHHQDAILGQHLALRRAQERKGDRLRRAFDLIEELQRAADHSLKARPGDHHLPASLPFQIFFHNVLMASLMKEKRNGMWFRRQVIFPLAAIALLFLRAIKAQKCGRLKERLCGRFESASSWRWPAQRQPQLAIKLLFSFIIFFQLMAFIISTEMPSIKERKWFWKKKVWWSSLHWPAKCTSLSSASGWESVPAGTEVRPDEGKLGGAPWRCRSSQRSRQGQRSVHHFLL